MTQAVIHVDQLRRTYGETVAVDNISFDVQQGEIFGIVGPNGAGKTTTVETLVGLQRPTNGRVQVLGFDPYRERTPLAQRIGVQLQAANLPERIKVWEALDLFASLYAQTLDWEQLLVDWGLAEKRNTAVDKLSGGQRQRLFIILALLNDPEIVFLDELTTGLDPQARRATWDLVREIQARGKTVILVTHFMDEIEALADRVAIIDQGRLVALDTPRTLIQELAQESRVTFTAEPAFTPTLLQGVNGISQVVQNGREVVVYGRGALLAHVAAALADHDMAPADLHVEQANLEDVFLALTGKHIRA